MGRSSVEERERWPVRWKVTNACETKKVGNQRGRVKGVYEHVPESWCTGTFAKRLGLHLSRAVPPDAVTQKEESAPLPLQAPGLHGTVP